MVEGSTEFELEYIISRRRSRGFLLSSLLEGVPFRKFFLGTIDKPLSLFQDP